MKYCMLTTHIFFSMVSFIARKCVKFVCFNKGPGRILYSLHLKITNLGLSQKMQLRLGFEPSIHLHSSSIFCNGAIYLRNIAFTKGIQVKYLLYVMLNYSGFITCCMFKNDLLIAKSAFDFWIEKTKNKK
jgi:hypothetical protein